MDSARVYRVGRDPSNDIVIEHSSVSRHHCQLKVLDDGAVELDDLGSMNGTSVRDSGHWRPVEHATVEHDERILLGEIVTTVAALLLRAPKSPGDAKPLPQPPRRIPQPTSPAPPAAAQLIQRVLKSDWARLNARRDGSRPKHSDEARNEPSICLPAMSQIDVMAAPPLPRQAPQIVIAAKTEREAVAEPETAAQVSAPMPSPLPADRIGISVQPRKTRRLWPHGIAAWSAVAAMLIVSGGIATAAYLRFASPETAVPASIKSAALLVNPGEAAIVRRLPGPEKEATAKEQPRSEESGPQPAAALKPRSDEKPKAPPPMPAGKASTWDRSVEGAGAASIAAAAATGDGGFCLAGRADAAGHGEAWIIRLDAAGQALWQRRIGGPRGDAALAVAASSDDGCIAAGYGQDATELSMLKIDVRGNQAWSRAVPVGMRGKATAIVALRNGGFAVAAHHKPQPGKPERAFVLRLNAAGEIKWSKYVGSGENIASDIKATMDDGMVVAGLGRASPHESLRLWLVRVAADGRMIWERRFASAANASVPYVQTSRGGDFTVAAASPGAIRLMRISSGGDTIWERRHDAEMRRVAGMIGTRGGIVVAGDSGERATRALWLAQYDDDGRPVHENRYPASSSDRLAAIAELKDGRWLLAGTAELGSPMRRGAGMLFVAAGAK